MEIKPSDVEFLLARAERMLRRDIDRSHAQSQILHAVTVARDANAASDALVKQLRADVDAANQRYHAEHELRIAAEGEREELRRALLPV